MTTRKWLGRNSSHINTEVVVTWGKKWGSTFFYQSSQTKTHNFRR